MTSRRQGPDLAISVEGLGKRYRLGEYVGPSTLREALADHLARAFGRRPADDARDLWALRDLTLGVRPGERVGILGRNGAGKSTLLRLLSRITAPTTGRIELRGSVGTLLEVGTGFHPELTGHENIYLNGAILGLTRSAIGERFDDIVAFSGIERFLDTPVKRYSSGMYVRLAFAVAAHLETDILLVDEVLAVGDVQFQRKCLGKMQALAGDKGRTILFVSHNIASVLQLCDRGIVLDDGRVCYDGDVREASLVYARMMATGRTARVALDSAARPSSLGDASFRLRAVELLDPPGNLVYRIGQQLRLRLEYDGQSVPEGTRLGVGLNTTLGQRLCTFHTQADATLRGFDELTLEVETALLKPGVYSIDVGARTGKISLDSLCNVIEFEISSLGVRDAVDDDDNFGLIALPHRFSRPGE